MRASTIRRNQEGSVAISVMVTFVATAITAAMLTTIWRDLRATRRHGDAANALQVADAGVNDAIKALSTAVAVAGGCPSISAAATAFSRTASIAGGTYTYCAFPDTDAIGRPVWHIDATGVDATGVKRRIRSDAISTPAFPNAINVMSAANFDSGFSIDSFKDEINRCTKKGKVATNSPQNFTFGNNGNNSSENCQNNPNGAYPYPPDGCVALSRDGDVTIPSNKIGTGQCPPAYTTAESPEFTPFGSGPPDAFDYPTTGTSPGANFVCDSAGEVVAGKVYYFTSVTLGENCGFASSGPFPTIGTPTKIYTTSLTIAGGSGNSGLNPINQPPNSAAVCGSTHGLSGADPMYCPGWAGGLQIFVVGSGSVTFSGNHSTFWGVISAPNSSVSWSGGGGAQWEIFGSMVAQSINGATQAKFHYDENLGSITSGRYYGQSWREEPITL